MWRHLLILCLAAGFLAGCAAVRGSRLPGEGPFAGGPRASAPAPGGAELGLWAGLALGLGGGLLAAWAWRRCWLRRGLRARQGRLAGGELAGLKAALEVLEGLLAGRYRRRPPGRRRGSQEQGGLRLVERAPRRRQDEG